jgi:predicted transport protein
MDRYLESIKAYFLLAPSRLRFPNDTEFERDLKVRDLYHFRSRSYWLRRLENHSRQEPVPTKEYTIEHILPQNENLSKTWRDALGPDWKRIQETWLHTLGNLTLTGYNAKYSDRSFPEKRDMTGGFRYSPLQLNEGLAQVEVWNEDAIRARANRLAKIALEVWPAPRLAEDVLEHYWPKGEAQAAYTIENHRNLVSGPMAGLFQAFRKEVLALDTCVTEEFLKLYVAYKAETNFVDVVPQSGCLLLILNLKFQEVHDPRGMCTDVTNIGHWGNGDVEVRLSEAKDLPYVMGLVRQAFEKQMGDGEAEL